MEQIFPADHDFTHNELRKAAGVSWPHYAGLLLLCWMRKFERFCTGELC